MIHPYRPNLDWHELLAISRPGAGRSEFESAVAARAGARYGIAFAYARSGIVAACKALGLAQAEVIMPAFTCSTVAEAIVVSGNKPVFVDIDLADYNMNVQAIREALTAQTRAVIATHMYGYPVDVDAICAAIGDHRVLVIEDAALLGPLNSDSGGAGLRGDLAVFSFGHGKHLYTVKGGVVVTNSADLYARIKAFRDKEMDSLPWKVWARRLAQLVNGYMMLNASLLEMLDKMQHTGSVQRARDKLGLAKVKMPADYDTAMADFQGRVGLAQLRKFGSILSRHRAWAEFYNRELRDVPGVSPPPIIEGATYGACTIRVERRDETGFCQQMLARGIEVIARFSYALPHIESYRCYSKGTYPRTEQAAREVVNLPNYAGLSAASARYVVESVQRSLAGSTRFEENGISTEV